MFKKEYSPDDGSIVWYKACLMAQGFSQVYRINFNETFLPTIRQESLQIFLAISCKLGLIIKQIDIVEAYLKSLLRDNNLFIFIKLSLSFKSFKSIWNGLVCRLLCSIYGLYQLRRLWNQKFVSFLISLGFRPLNTDTSILIYHGKEEDNMTIMSLYIDNFLLVSKFSSSMK